MTDMSASRSAKEAITAFFSALRGGDVDAAL